MQCTAPHAPPSSVPLSVSPRSLAAAFAHVPDPRRPASVTYALAAILTLAVAAILANQGRQTPPFEAAVLVIGVVLFVTLVLMFR
jgi:hypothetical protein